MSHRTQVMLLGEALLAHGNAGETLADDAVLSQLVSLCELPGKFRKCAIRGSLGSRAENPYKRSVLAPAAPGSGTGQTR